MIQKGSENVDYIAITDANNNVDYPVKVWFANANNTLKLIYERPTYDIHIINLSIATKLGNANKVTNIIFTNNLSLRNQAYNNNIVNVTYQNNIPTFEFLVQNADNDTFTCYIANPFWGENSKIYCYGDFSRCFAECTILTTINNLTQFDTSNITSFALYFDNCYKLATLDLSNFATTNATSFTAMFRYCMSLTNIDLRNFTTSNVTSFNYMFSRCQKLIRLDLSNFDTTNSTSFYCMFQHLPSLKFLKLNFNTANCSSMFAMFQEVKNIISLNLTFNTANVTNMFQMFTNCNNLKRIFSFAFIKTNLQDDSSMFENLFKIKGGNGTTYDANHIDSEYARIDGENGLPGYFTDPADAIKITLINVDNEGYTDELYLCAGDTYTLETLQGYTAVVSCSDGNTYSDGDTITITQEITLTFSWTVTA